MFGIDYTVAVVIIGVVMIGILLLGGMLATTWVQIIKSSLLLGGAFLLAVLVLAKYGFNPLQLFHDAAQSAGGDKLLAPGDKVVTGSWDAVSLGLALMFGTAGLPHILMRFYTVPDAKSARTSVSVATTLIGCFYLLTFILGFGAMGLVGQNTIKGVEKGGNMAAPLLAQELGGHAFLGFIAAVAFATILAVVAGLALAGAAALSHDLWVHVVRHGEAPEREQLMVAKVATAVMGALAIVLGIALEGQNVAFMVGLAFAVAASANFPALLLSIYWRRMTTWGTVASIIVGTVTALVLIYISPTIQVDVLKHADAIFPLKNPAVVSMPVSFLTAIVVSQLTRETRAEQRYREAGRQILLGAAGPQAPAFAKTQPLP
jgi:cation/acetate symporter